MKKTKQFLAALLSCALLLSCFVMPIGAEEAAQGVFEITVNDELLVFEDAKPFIENDRTLVPIRPFCAALGIADEAITYQEGTVTIRVTIDGKECDMILTIGSPTIKIGDRETTIDVAPKIVEDCTYVPLRFISEALGGNVLYYGPTPVYANRTLVSVQTAAYTVCHVYLPESLREAGADKLLRVAAEMSDINQVHALIGVNDTIVEKMTLMLAAGEPAIFMDTGYVSDEAFAHYLEAEAFVKLDDYIAKYAPKTLEKIKSDEELQKRVCGADGGIYAFPVEQNGRVDRMMVSSAIRDPEKAVALIHAYNELVKSLAEASAEQ